MLTCRIDCIKDTYDDPFEGLRCFLGTVQFSNWTCWALHLDHSILKVSDAARCKGGTLVHQVIDRHGQVVDHKVKWGKDFIDGLVVGSLVANFCSQRLHREKLDLEFYFANRIVTLLYFLLAPHKILLLAYKFVLTHYLIFFNGTELSWRLSNFQLDSFDLLRQKSFLIDFITMNAVQTFLLLVESLNQFNLLFHALIRSQQLSRMVFYFNILESIYLLA